MPKLVPTVAAATAAAVGLYLPAIGAFGPLDACLPTGAVASAAPSPTCASDLRECLRLSADIRQTTFGGRYVTAEDVARCTEVFTACIHGGLSGGGNPVPPPSTSAVNGDDGKGLPQHFGITSTSNGEVDYDCRRSGDTLSCKLTLLKPFGSTDSSTATFTGTLSGLTATGTTTGHSSGHAPANPSCGYEQDFSGPSKYVFSLDGTVAMHEGPFQINATNTGSCPGSSSFTGEAYDTTGTWSALK